MVRRVIDLPELLQFLDRQFPFEGEAPESLAEQLMSRHKARAIASTEKRLRRLAKEGVGPHTKAESDNPFSEDNDPGSVSEDCPPRLKRNQVEVPRGDERSLGGARDNEEEEED